MVEDMLQENETERLRALQGLAFRGQGHEPNVPSSVVYCVRERGYEGCRYATEAAAVMSRMWQRDSLQRVQRRAMC